MKSFAAVAALAAVASAGKVADLAKFLKYINAFNKSYATLEEVQARAELYFAAEELINEHNAQNASFTLSHNQFSDMTETERTRMLGYKPQAASEKNIVAMNRPANGESDFRDTCVTPVKNQGSCGSCWSFSSTGALEGAHCVSSGELLSFSEQFLVDCDPYDGGCNGGLQENAFTYLQSNAIILEENYPYKGRDGSCKQDATENTGIYVDQIVNITPNSPDEMKAALDQQPLAVAIEADKLVFQLYSGGIFDSAKCGTNLDHAVLLVGYGSENGQDYFILKNSWDTTWGEEGYMKIAVADGAGICGVQNDPLYPTVTQ